MRAHDCLLIILAAVSCADNSLTAAGSDWDEWAFSNTLDTDDTNGLGVEAAGDRRSPVSPLATGRRLEPTGYVGCYADCSNDLVSTRAMPYEVAGSEFDTKAFPNGNVTIQDCQRLCRVAGYDYAGLQYGWQCYCGDSYDSCGSDDTGCDYTCIGDSPQICGGAYYNSVYQTRADQIDCLLHNGGCGSNSTCSDSGCLCDDGYITQNGASNDCRTSYESGYLGCFADFVNSSRVLDFLAAVSDLNTPAWCKAACAQANYQYAGVELAQECHCSNNTNYGTQGEKSGQCIAPCAGDSSQYCGYWDRISVYNTSSEDSPTPPPTSGTTAQTPAPASGTPGTSKSISGVTVGVAVAGSLAGALVLACVGLRAYRSRKPRHLDGDTGLPPGSDEEAAWAVKGAYLPASASVQSLDEPKRPRHVAFFSGSSAGKLPSTRIPGDVELSKQAQEATTARARDVAAIVAGTACGGVLTVGKYIPWVRSVVGLLGEVVHRFETAQANRGNCAKVVQWAEEMSHELGSLEEEYTEQDAPPAAQCFIHRAREALEDLLETADTYNKDNLFMQFVNSETCKCALETADANLRQAVAHLNLSVSRATLRGVHELRLESSEQYKDLARGLALNRVLIEGMAVSLAGMAAQIYSSRHGNRHHSRGPSEADSEAAGEALRRLQIAAEEVTLTDELVGEGSSAKVYLCQYQGKIRAAKVATLKNCTEDQFREIYKKFAKELHIMSMLDHPKVVKIFGAVTTAQQLTIVMELGERGSLRGLLDNAGQWAGRSPPAQHVLLKDIAAGMAYLYSQRVQHRDLKSLNVLITGDWRAKITDFGLAKTLQLLPTEGGSSQYYGGTLAWKAPELLDESGEFTEKSDVYSFGVILWEVTCGGVRRPWQGLDADELTGNVLQGNRLHIRLDCPDAYRNIMLAAWQDPECRPTFSTICAELKTSRWTLNAEESTDSV